MYPSIPTIILTGAGSLRWPSVAPATHRHRPSPVHDPIRSQNWWGFLAIILVLNIPYFSSSGNFGIPGEVKYTLTALSLDSLAKDGVPDDMLNKLKTMEGKVYPNRDRFLAALKREAGDVKPLKVLRFILLSASEEEEFED
jgi:hypothetical protein